MGITFTPEQVAAYEHATWSRCATGYDDGFGALTSQAVPPLLAAAGIEPGHVVLDIGTGTGVVAAAANRLGADVIGIDFSEAMISAARARVPDLTFETAAAEALPFDDGAFDAVIANAVLHHLGDPALALQQARRVLRSTGRIACTVWAEPETLEAFGIVFGAVAAHAGAAELPHGPLFGVTDESTLASLFAHAGFSDVSIDTVDTIWRMASIDSLLDAFAPWAQLDAFPPDTRRAIEAQVRESAAAYTDGNGVAIPNPMLLISATRAE